jgi:hypothetical protein
MANADCIPATFETVDATMVAPAVTLTAATATSGGQSDPVINATWSAIANPYVTHVELRWVKTGGSTYRTLKVPKGDLGAVLTSLLVTTQYDVSWRAVGDGVVGPWKAPVVQVTTLTVQKSNTSGTADGIVGQGTMATNNWTVSATAPPSPAVGDLWIDTSTTPFKLKRWNGTIWDPQASLNVGVLADLNAISTVHINTGAAVRITASQDLSSSVTIPSATGHALLKSMNFTVDDPSSKITVVVSFYYWSSNANESHFYLKIGQTAPVWSTSGNDVMTNADDHFIQAGMIGLATAHLTFTGLPAGTNTLEVWCNSIGSGSHTNKAQDTYFSVTEDKKAA